MKNPCKVWVAICFLLSFSPALIFCQGLLTPPGAPAPTMKSLDQVRSTGIALNSTNTPGDSSYAFIVSAPGSYFLSGNLHVSGTNGIHVTAPGVTIDLNGFQIDRASGSGGTAISIDATAHRCVVKSGSIVGFGYGIISNASGGAFAGLAVSGCTLAGLSAGTGWRIEECQAHDLAGDGMIAGTGATLARCTALNCGGYGIRFGDHGTATNCASRGSGSSGIQAGSGCTITNCTANGGAGIGIGVASNCTLLNCNGSENSSDGINGNNNCTLTNCTASANNGSSAFSAGIRVSDNSSLIGCIACGNTTSASSHLSTSGAGISLGNNCLVDRCVASSNAGDGVAYGSRCVLTGNNASQNGFTGFRSNGSINRIDGNTADANGQVGIFWNNDYVVRNTAFVNTGLNYNPAVGTGNTGPLQAAGSATNPWANF